MRLRMLQVVAVTGLFAVAVLAAPRAAPQGAAAKWPFRSVRYEQRVTVGQGRGSRQQYMRGFAKAGKTRLESATYTLISNGKQAWIYWPKIRQAMTMPVSEVRLADGSRQTLERNMRIGRKVGTEKAGGYLCDVYVASIPNARGKVTRTKVWVHPKWNLPIRAETAAPGAPTIVVETLNIKTNVRLEDGLFALPKGTTIVEHFPAAKPPAK